MVYNLLIYNGLCDGFLVLQGLLGRKIHTGGVHSIGLPFARELSPCHEVASSAKVREYGSIWSNPQISG